MKYAAIFEKAVSNWSAYIPDLPGCVTTGKTLEETRRLMAEAIEFHIEGLRLGGYPVPEPNTVAESVEVAAALRPAPGAQPRHTDPQEKPPLSPVAPIHPFS